jgi:hypothetical protein
MDWEMLFTSEILRFAQDDNAVGCGDNADNVGSDGMGYWSLAYSDLACWRMGMLGSASFQMARKS